VRRQILAKLSLPLRLVPIWDEYLKFLKRYAIEHEEKYIFKALN
jgi:hypothetical protein